MKNAFAIVTLSALLSACAIAPQKPVEPPAEPQPAEPAVAEAPAPAPAPVAEALPNTELTGDLLFRLTKAELEFKNGQWQGPYITMMALGQQTRDPRLARRATEMALTAKQPGEAMAAIRLWRSLAPESEEAAQFFLSFAVTADDLGEAEALFEQRLKDAKPATRPLLMFQMQQFLQRAQDKNAAYKLQDRVLMPYEAMLEPHLILAQGAFALNDPVRARSEAAKALAIKPDSELAILTSAQVSGDVDNATQQLKGFLDKYPQAREVRAAYGRILTDNKQPEEARKQFLLLLKDQPDNLATLYALGVLAVQVNDAAEAEKYLSRFVTVLEEHPDDERNPAKVLHILAELAQQRGDLDAAYAWLEKVDESDEKIYLAARIKMAVLTARKGNTDAARKQLEELKPSDPNDQAQVFQTDAQLLRDAGDHRAAYVVLDNATKRYPGNPDLLYDFALVAEKLGDVELMEKALRQVMIAAPDNQHAYNALGYSLAERNERLPEAYSLIDKAMQMAPGDPFIMDSMGWVQFRMGKLAEAESYLRRAYALRNDPEIAVHLGEVLFVKGDIAGAQKLWKEAHAKDPKNDALKSTLARLNQSL
ncbi:tetratricopeptide repeat protein [Duganella sp. sic0402]|uniref:tetratricopeptide repeat protein n=1 Tax=Duganella sp. sic0402 TaxID=2854786 RepID=UPI001C44FB9B|nr:tetratricopeptide repeat protein [Duganella sp. sic0402]MBV7539294.1 tetratricopeptide repeat protein [Duganella sp. sic0402]